MFLQCICSGDLSEQPSIPLGMEFSLVSFIENLVFHHENLTSQNVHFISWWHAYNESANENLPYYSIHQQRKFRWALCSWLPTLPPKCVQLMESWFVRGILLSCLAWISPPICRCLSRSSGGEKVSNTGIGSPWILKNIQLRTYCKFHVPRIFIYCNSHWINVFITGA